MAYFSGNIKSRALDMDTQLVVYMPHDSPPHEKDMITPVKTVYLLHGQSSNASSWMRWTSVFRYAQERGIALIMPEVQRSFYLNMKYGLNYNTYISEELPQICEDMFNISTQAKDRYIAGYSMGGYGAMRIGFDKPHQYAGIASLSGLCDIKALTNLNLEDMDPAMIGEYKAILGENLDVEDKDDLYFLSKQVSQLPKHEQPKLFTCCGIEDDLVSLNEQNSVFKEYLENLNLRQYKYMQWHGIHDWKFWDEAIQHVFDYFFDEE